MKGGRLLRTGGLGLLGLVVVWTAVVLYWRSAGISPTAGHLVTWLFLLPLALLGGWLLARRVQRRIRARGANAAPSAQAGDAGLPQADEGPQPDRLLYLLGSATWLRAGQDGAAVAQALAQPQRPPLHARLKDQLGLPVFAAEVDGLDPSMVAPALEAALVASGNAGPAERIFGEEALRALALLDPVVEDLLFTALPPASSDTGESSPVGGMHPHAMHHSRSSRASAPAAAASQLRVRLLVPAAWPAVARTASGAWLDGKARAVGFVEGQFTVEVTPAAGAVEVWRCLERLGQPDAGEPGDTHLLLAVHSSIGEASVDRLDARRELLVSGHPEGLVPGEGAAGVLLAAGCPGEAGSGPKPVRLHRLLHGRAGQGRGAGRAAATLLQRALETAAQPVDDIALVFSDADHRPSRAIEIAAAIAMALPELEPVDDTRHLGLACGDTGAVAPLALLSTAAAHVIARQAPVLAVSLADSEARVALVLSPLAVSDAVADDGTRSRTPAAAAAIA